MSSVQYHINSERVITKKFIFAPITKDDSASKSKIKNDILRAKGLRIIKVYISTTDTSRFPGRPHGGGSRRSPRATGNWRQGHVQSDCPKWLELKEREAEVADLLEKYNALAAKHGAEILRRNDAPAAAATDPAPAPARPLFVAVSMPVPASDPAAPAAHASDKAVQSDCPKFLQLQEREAEVAVGLQQVHPGSGPGIRGRGPPRMFSWIMINKSYNTLAIEVGHPTLRRADPPAPIGPSFIFESTGGGTLEGGGT
ncbi:hypothetical protein HYE67_000946 [Fusarium culmorum]|uniref:Uncharacterized protein n=1 Tax=Fusarium culmorum TaxID=5516 RepID=A0A7S8CYR0_FUSCU|nr:hypothetical protein HYE67_000946 [Fusarium culmorum]